MSNSIPESVSNCACECGTGQVKSTIACPICRRLGSTLNFVTPKNTVNKESREKLDSEKTYHFCDNPDCEAVYYNEEDTSVFTSVDLKNRVTLKDDSPETPLCYCFKVLKKHALEEIARTGTTDIFSTIQAKMKPGQSCFCEKSNPRGDTCVEDIQSWLDAQGVSTQKPVVEESESCCEPQTSCCDSSPSDNYPKGGCRG